MKIIILCLVLSQVCLAQPKIEKFNIESLSKKIQYKGDIINAVRWTDKTGDNIVVLSATLKTAVPDKIILEMPFGSLPATVEGKMRMAGVFAKPIAGLLTFWGGSINGFWAFGMKPKEFVKKIKCPVLLQWGKKDKGVTEKEINELFKNIVSSKEFVVYENSGHENLCENEPNKWEDTIEAFLAK